MADRATNEQEEPEPATLTDIVRSALRVITTLAVLFAAYALLPGTEETDWSRALAFSLVLVALIALVVFDIRSIARAAHPGLRAAEVLATADGFFLVAVSLVYLGISHSNGKAFTQPLDHITALYFTTVVFSTVGFGDIYARTDAARLVVTIQIFLDILFIAVVVRLVIGAVQRRLSHR